MVWPTLGPRKAKEQNRLGSGLVRVSSRVRVRVKVKVRVSILVRVSIRSSWVVNFALFRCYRSVIYSTRPQLCTALERLHLYIKRS